MNQFLLANEGAIYVLSAIISLSFGMVIFTLRRSAAILQENKWAKPFAITFFVLAGMYFLRFVGYFLEQSLIYKSYNQNLINPIVSTCSGVTNFLFLLSAFRLSEAAIDRRPFLRKLKDRLLSGRSEKSSRRRGKIFQALSILLLCLVGLLQSKGGVAVIPDALISTFTLLLMGIVLFRTIYVSHDRLMGLIALVSGIFYGILTLLSGVGFIRYIIVASPADSGTNTTTVASLITFLISLLLKYGLFFPGFYLMLLVSGPLERIERLLKNVSKQQKEYLGSGGIVESIREELQLKSVHLYVRLPSLEENQIAHFAAELPLSAYSPLPPGTKDGEPEVFKYKEISAYGKVIKGGQPDIESKPVYRYLRRMTVVAVPIFFHNSVIACLRVVVGKERFTEAHLINLTRIADMVSPIVQAYREISALNKVNGKLAELQIGIKQYEMEKDVGNIMEIIHDVISPQASGISIEIGFSEYRSTYPKDEDLAALVNAQLDAKPVEEDIKDLEANRRWLKKELKISMVNSSYEKIGDHVFGTFALLTKTKRPIEDYPTLGTNPTFRNTIADLMMDALLDFIRGGLNQLTDTLGFRLSGLKGTTAAAWHEEVEKIAQDAKLPWAVASYSDEDDNEIFLGKDEWVKLVCEVEALEQTNKWQPKDGGFKLYTLDETIYPPDETKVGTYHIIKKTLSEYSNATLWLGVAREGFGRELDYISPWMYFLDHFCSIADSALHRILMEEREENQIKAASQMFELTSALTADNVLHEVIGVCRRLTNSLLVLESAVDGLSSDHILRKKVLSLRPEIAQIEELFTSLINALKSDENPSCSLDKVVEEVRQKAQSRWSEHNITIEKPTSSRKMIAVPFHVANLAFNIILGNSKDEFINKGIENGCISIKVKDLPDRAGRLVCEITDNGLGISEELRKTLLKGRTQSDKNHSKGVGLLISTFMLRGYRGNITIAPQQPGKGATFRIHFPIAKAKAPASETQHQRSSE